MHHPIDKPQQQQQQPQITATKPQPHCQT